MLTEERKAELVADLEYAVNKYLDKKWIVSEACSDIAEDEEEKEFLQELNGYFEIQYKGE